MFRPPYRWTARPIENLRSCWLDLTGGIANLWRWAPVIWNDHDWDWEPLAEVLIFKLRRMERSTEHWAVQDASRSRREMQVARALLERIVQDDYEGQPPYTRDGLRIAANQRRDDLWQFGKILGTKLLYWWD